MKKRIHLTETGNFHIGETDVDEKCIKRIRMGITFHRYYPHSMKSCVRCPYHTSDKKAAG